MRLTPWTIAAVLAVLVSIAARVHAGFDGPLWLDESWTGAFASLTDPRELLHQIREDANAPLYYLGTWAWAKVFGVSNLSLRAPSLLFMMSASLVAWLGLKGERPRAAALWCVLIALWPPGLFMSSIARCYALLVLFGVANVIAYGRLLSDRTLSAATIWAASAGMMILTHYDAAFLALAQGVVFLGLERERAWRLWPAAIVFAPVGAWLAWHAPFVAHFARPGVAWYPRFSPADLPDVFDYLLVPQTWMVCAVILGVAWLAEFRGAAISPMSASQRALWVAAATSVLGAALCLVVAASRPSFTPRYLTAFAPGVLLLLVLAIERACRRRPTWPIAAIATATLFVMPTLFALSVPTTSAAYGFERASAWIAQRRPARLVFFWDHPATAVEARDQLDLVGGFFLRRAGESTAVIPIYRMGRQDMNAVIAAQAGGDVAALWLYDLDVIDTTARIQPPHLEGSRSWECRDFGKAHFGVYACRPRAS